MLRPTTPSARQCSHHTCRERLFLRCFLCLSRACLDKMTIFVQKWHPKSIFRTNVFSNSATAAAAASRNFARQPFPWQSGPSKALPSVTGSFSPAGHTCMRVYPTAILFVRNRVSNGDLSCACVRTRVAFDVEDERRVVSNVRLGTLRRVGEEVGLHRPMCVANRCDAV